MHSITFDNLVDSNGKKITIELGEVYKPICVEMSRIRKAARKSARGVKRVFGHEQR